MSGSKLLQLGQDSSLVMADLVGFGTGSVDVALIRSALGCSFLTRKTKNEQPRPPSSFVIAIATMDSDLSIAYLAGGKLHLKQGDRPTRTLDSEFGQSVVERTEQQHRRNAWKTESRGNNPMLSGSGLWGQQGGDPDSLNLAITSVSAANKGRDLYYTLAAGTVNGVFSLRLGDVEAGESDQKEQRLFHGSDFQIRYLETHPQGERLACSAIYGNGSANILTMRVGQSFFTDITEGDSVDIAPRWVQGDGMALVYQSAGIGRNASGVPVGQSPFAIEKIDFDRQTHERLVEDPKHDSIAPQMTADGTLYYIRRPYRSKKEMGPLQLLWDLILIPFRFLNAIYQWLNFFTLRFTGKPLRQSGEVANPSNWLQMMMAGNLSNAQREAMRHDGALDGEGLVPATWELVRRGVKGDTQVLATSVLAFDVSARGDRIVYSNGNGIFAIDKAGKSSLLLEDAAISTVAIVE